MKPEKRGLDPVDFGFLLATIVIFFIGIVLLVASKGEPEAKSAT